MDLGPHAGFIWASYAVTAVVVILLVMHVVGDERRQRKTLAQLEAQGVRRRSDPRSDKDEDQA